MCVCVCVHILLYTYYYICPSQSVTPPQKQASGRLRGNPLNSLQGFWRGSCPLPPQTFKHATPLSKGLAVIRHSQLYKGM